jgi:hypothetical protein
MMALRRPFAGAGFALAGDMRSSCALLAIVFLGGCQSVPSGLSQVESARPDGGDGKLAGTDLSSAHDGGATTTVTDALSAVATDMATPKDLAGAADFAPPTDLAKPSDGPSGDLASPGFCANQIDPGTHNVIAMRADDHDLYYFDFTDFTNGVKLMALAKDGTSSPRLVAAARAPLGDAPYDVAVDATEAYFEDGRAVWRVAKSGGTPEQLYAPPVTDHGAASIVSIAVDDSNVYWRQIAPLPGWPEVDSMPKAGGTSTDVGVASHIVADGRSLYGMYFADLWAKPTSDGGASFDIAPPSPTGVFTSDATRLVFGGNDGVISIVAGDGRVTRVGKAANAIDAIAIESGTIYYIDQTGLWRVDLAGPHLLYAPREGGLGPDLIVDSGYVYTQTICNILRLPR